ncbi:hypothetical protein A5653_02365 [Mycobacterium colombiense]|uniref:PPE family protein n=1 Tax=Mycobacterium colombiense TaxID=339268 RepID=UPI0007EF6F54|nr:PPE family protein [Mycobacterium colombiense]OBK66685.1 hypothetical protein A5653_02365 [Mycobacterium colombiense]
MDYAKLAPEINSALICSGPAAGSMMLAAAAWETLAVRLWTAAADYRAVTAKLTSRCQGAASTPITTAAVRYIDWLDALAAGTEHAATQLQAAAEAYQSARTAMVPPTVIADNRTYRASLVSANCLGHNSPVIADLDAAYDVMWAQNADAMYGYARAAADAVTVTPFTPAPGNPVVPKRDWFLQPAREVISVGHQVMTAIPTALKQGSSSPLTTFDTVMSPATASLSKLNSLTATSDCAIGHLNAMNKAAALQAAFPKPAGANEPRAGVGRATAIGVRSVPHTWSTTTPQAAAITHQGWVREPLRLVAASQSSGPHPASEYGH